MRPARNKQSILEASLRIFCEKGFSDASMKDISTAAGVSTGNIYNYFSSKEELFEHLFKLYFPGNYIEALLAGIKPQKEFEKNIETALNNIISVISRNPYFFKLLMIDANEFNGKFLDKYNEVYIKPIEKYFDDGSKGISGLRKDIDSIDITAFLAWLFHSIGITNIIYRENHGRILKNTPIYDTLLKIMQKGLKE